MANDRYPSPLRGDPSLRSRSAAFEFHQSRRRTRHDAGRGELPDQAAGGAAGRAAVPSAAAGACAHRGRPVAGAPHHRGVRPAPRRLFALRRARTGDADRQHHAHLRSAMAGAATRRLPAPPSQDRSADGDDRAAGRFLREEVDVVIRSGKGKWRRLVSLQARSTFASRRWCRPRSPKSVGGFKTTAGSC